MFENVKKWLPFKRGDRSAKRIPAHAQAATAPPWTRMDREMSEWVDRVGFGSLRSLFADHGSDSWFGDFSAAAFHPTLDVADKSDHLEIAVELPGLAPEDVEIDVRNGELVIRGQKRHEATSEDDGFYRTERAFGAFERAVPLPSDVEFENGEATFKSGVLTIKLPKTATAAAATKIAIRS